LNKIFFPTLALPSIGEERLLFSPPFPLGKGGDPLNPPPSLWEGGGCRRGMEK